MTKLFLTGATGYIGGDLLEVLTATYPDLQITALVRNSDKGAQVASQYPSVRLVYGDLDSTDVITKAASESDIVVNTANCDHAASASAIIAGLAQRTSSSKAYFIHTSGTGILTSADLDTKTFGIYREKVFDDWQGIKEVVNNLPDTALHRTVDKIVLAASHDHPGKIATAIVCPPCIYGVGRGPGNQKSQQAYRLARATLKRGKGVQVGEGKNMWTQVHVRDLSNVFLALFTEAMSAGGGKATWDDEGYYFAEAGGFVWGDVSKGIAKVAKKNGWIESEEVESVSAEEADRLVPMASYMWGSNSRCMAYRARKVLGWQPKEKGLLDTLEEIVEVEARELGVDKGHAAKAAGEA
ncbi:NAD(P)-binding protein [Sporormia fimetaria CBS 119925]|uniref:NAD(P)-binding protein n=1 Tax=Sporormia fimetaria CBS 119925 TaxID=1340428 RepID=A0A6A6VMA5_9PLEO|nr:NAD(P)-binding protein [Sporormia fimetaria CBS 119925]